MDNNEPEEFLRASLLRLVSTLTKQLSHLDERIEQLEKRVDKNERAAIDMAKALIGDTDDGRGNEADTDR